MKQFFYFSLIFLLLLLSSCAFDKDAVLEYDLYKVDVNTYLNVRETPNKRGKIVGTINDGAIINVAEIKEGWAAVIYDGKQVGYVSSEYLTFYKARTIGNQPTDEMSDEDLDVVCESESTQSDHVPHNKESSQLAASSIDDERIDSVRFVGDDFILSENERQTIRQRLSLLHGYIFVINTVENVETGELFDYAPDLLENLTKEMDSEVSWWKRFKSWFGSEIPSSNLVLLSYIKDDKDGGLLQAECNGSSLKYVKMKEPHKYFDCQTEAAANPVYGIISMGELIANGGDEYNDRNWFIRKQIDAGDILENICDGLIVENILPCNSFWHKWVFGWVFAWPLAVANWLLTILGSYLTTLFVFMLIIVSMQYYVVNQIYKGAKGFKGTAFLIMLMKIFMWLCMLSLIVYMFPDLTKIFVMKEAGYSSGICRMALNQFSSMSMPSNWFLIVVFIVGTIVCVGIKEGFIVDSTLSSSKQKSLYLQNEKNIEEWMQACGVDYNKDALKNDETPYLTLSYEYFGSKVGATVPVLIISFIFSGALLLYASLFLWTKALQKIVGVLVGILAYKKGTLYK